MSNIPILKSTASLFTPKKNSVMTSQVQIIRCTDCLNPLFAELRTPEFTIRTEIMQRYKFLKPASLQYAILNAQSTRYTYTKYKGYACLFSWGD